MGLSGWVGLGEFGWVGLGEWVGGFVGLVGSFGWVGSWVGGLVLCVFSVFGGLNFCGWLVTWLVGNLVGW